MEKKVKKCQMCKKDLDVFDLESGITLDYVMGYGSKHDGERMRLMLCCGCTDRIGEVCGAFETGEEPEETADHGEE